MSAFDAFYYLVLVIAWAPLWAPAAVVALCWASTRRTRRDPWDTAAAELATEAADGPAVDTDATAAFHARIRSAMDIEACRDIWASGVADDHAREEDPRP